MLITHRMSILSFCDQVAVLNAGTVLAFGPRDAILERIDNAPPQRQASLGRTVGALALS